MFCFTGFATRSNSDTMQVRKKTSWSFLEIKSVNALNADIRATGSDTMSADDFAESYSRRITEIRFPSEKCLEDVFDEDRSSRGGSADSSVGNSRKSR